MAFFLGKFFDTFGEFATGKFDGETFMTKSFSSFAALFVAAAATFLLKGTLFSLWLVFGELQARRVRELLFASLLDRDIEWYEARTKGVGTLMITIRR
jgi:ATP-binding cassette subfamily B (MDR/TAP) protein 1